MQNARIIRKFTIKYFDIFLIHAKNMDCGYSLELPELPHQEPTIYVFKKKKKEKKNRYTPEHPSFSINYKRGYKGGIH